MSEREVPSGEQVEAFVNLVFEHAMSQPLSAFVDPAELIKALDEALTLERLTSLHTRLSIPQRTTLLTRAKASSKKVADAFPPAIADGIANHLGRPSPLPKKLVEQLVTSDKAREELRNQMHETISSFVSKGMGGGSDSGGLRGALGRGAMGFAAAGKGLLGGLGDSLQKQLQDKVRDFVDGSVATVQTKIAARLLSEDTAKNIGKRKRALFLSALEKTEAEVAGQIEKGPLAETDAIVPAIIRHNLSRPEVRDALREVAEQTINELSKKPIGETLNELGLREAARRAVQNHGIAFAKSFVASAPFGAFWKTLG